MNQAVDPLRAPNCMRCLHHYVTWDTRFPYGCRALGFKSLRLPSQEVFASSGQHCLHFHPRPVPAR
ncbi:hypothetical protein [Chitinimonas sp.]|uniref:hypothetical protein n=1 Tax=Chitinimonas sp. TaxID=1934313 RepID=UPI002F948B66